MTFNITLLQTVLDTMNEGVLVIDHRSKDVLEYNKCFLKMWGIHPDIAASKNYALIMEKIISRLLKNASINHLMTNSEVKSFDLVELKDDIFFEIKTEPLIIDSKCVGRILYFKDVTVERAAKKSLEAQNALLETILSSIPYSVFWKDKNLNYLGCNKRFAADAGKSSSKELIGKSDYDMPWSKTESDFFRSIDQKIMASGQAMSNIEETQKTANGRETTVLTSKVPLMDEHNEVTGILGIYTDITEFKNNQQIIKDQEVLLVSASQLSSLGEMAGGIAHEINNPLSIIKASTIYFNKMLLKDTFDRVKAKEILDQVDSTVERISKIIMGLRNISRGSDGEKHLCCYREVIHDVLSVANEKFKASGITLRNDTEDFGLDEWFMGNRIQLSQVLINLLNNSYDALRDSGGHDKWVELKIEKNQTSINLYVTDSGEGIPLEIRSKIFNPFFTTKEIGKGTGIGLSISKTMIERLQGNLIYNEKSPHTCFIIQFPLEANAQAS